MSINHIVDKSVKIKYGIHLLCYEAFLSSVQIIAGCYTAAAVQGRTLLVGPGTNIEIIIHWSIT